MMPEDTVDERSLWQARPSQLLNVPKYATLLAVAVASTATLLALRGQATRDVTLEQATQTMRMIPWLIAAVWLFCLLLAVYFALKLASVKYELTTERLRITTGLLSTTTEELELRRVRDYVVARPFWQRIVGLGEVRLTSADATAPQVSLKGVRDPDSLQGQIRTLVQGLMRRYGVREIDVM